MQLVPLKSVAQQVTVGVPLLFSVRDSSGKLLLARGQRIMDQHLLVALLKRGMFVDKVELDGEVAQQPRAPAPRMDANTTEAEFHSRWQYRQESIRSLLTEPSAPLDRLVADEAASLIDLSAAHPDRTIFQILRRDQSRYGSYGASHALHVAAMCGLTARRMGWPEEVIHSLVCAALTMNISIINLQGQLASQHGRMTDEQRHRIRRHPQDSAAMLSAAGVTDMLWLQAVEQHHETPDGQGYPQGRVLVCDLAQMLHHVDIFAAKISARATRRAMMPNQAARSIFLQKEGHPLAVALIKEFGIYPPGCFVKLQSGEAAIVVQRGKTANTPVVKALTDAHGRALAKPLTRDTADKAFAVTSATAEANIMIKVPWHLLFGQDEAGEEAGVTVARLGAQTSGSPT
jgi:HD-GYP domain-containing protein (c-di-GMP phosphodiesterase class II)